MMKLCINCCTLHADDVVLCSDCGKNLIKVPTGEEALERRKAHEADHLEGARGHLQKPRPPSTRVILSSLAGLLVTIVICAGSELGMPLWEQALEDFPAWVSPSPGTACLQSGLFFGLTLAFMGGIAWVAATGLGGEIGRRRETRQLGAYMTRTHAAGMQLSEADLEGADARGAVLRGAMLVRANLAEANLEAAILSQARVAGANLRSANLCRANLAGAELSGADLERADAEGACLEGATLVEANLTGANLRGASLSHANLEGSGLSHVNFLRATLRDANLARANLRSAYLCGVGLRAALLREANLEKADLRYTNLEGANLDGARLAGADVDHTTVMPEGWKEMVATKPGDKPDR
jgi:uncharacterized protein YjbI with pentapeptide repeats